MAFAFAELLNQEAKDLEALGVDVVQFDEPAFNVYLDETVDWGVPALEKAAEGLKCTTAVHICYGYGIEANIKWKDTLGESWRQYEKTFPALDRSKIQQVSLEVRNSHVPPELMKLLKTKTVLVGAIDVASDRIETPEEVAATLKLATRFVDPERIQACTNCGMAPMTLATAYGKLAGARPRASRPGAQEPLGRSSPRAAQDRRNEEAVPSVAAGRARGRSARLLDFMRRRIS